MRFITVVAATSAMAMFHSLLWTSYFILLNYVGQGKFIVEGIINLWVLTFLIALTLGIFVGLACVLFKVRIVIQSDT